MRGPDPADYGWWLASRASGVLALLCIAASVGIGLAMAGRVSRRPALARTLMALHQQTALVGMVAIAVHGITLLGDSHLHPGLVGISVPFVIDHAPLWTGLGVTGGWLAAILGLSYWLRDRIGPARWRKLHRATILVYVLSVAHTLGSGTDAGEPWLRLLLVATGAPILFLFVVRVLPAPKPAPAFRRFRVAEITPESMSVTSFALEPADGKKLAPFAPGQFLTVRLGALTRSYSLSAAPNARRHRISVKREPGGAMSERLHTAVEVGDVLEAGGPHGEFVLDESRAPVVLVSAGIGATPLLAMLAVLARRRSKREVWWVHGARSGAEHPFREEVRELVEQLPDGHLHVRYSRPDARDVAGRDYDATGRVTAEVIESLGIPDDARFHLCGPSALIDDLVAALPADRTRFERFGPAAPTSPPVDSPSGAHIAFSRSGVTARWDGSHANLLELAEECDVPAQSGCRVGACHGCRTAVVAGEVTESVDGDALLCQARPRGDLVLDL